MGTRRPRVLLGMDVNYPPYAQLSGMGLAGLGVDFVNLMNAQCDLEVRTSRLNALLDWVQNS